VMVAFQTDFKQVFELPIFGDVARRQMTVIVENRLALGELMIELASRLGLQKKIFVNERHTWCLVSGVWSSGVSRHLDTQARRHRFIETKVSNVGQRDSQLRSSRRMPCTGPARPSSDFPF